MPYCGVCERWFSSTQAFRQHISASPRHYYCKQCEKEFMSAMALEQHYIQSTAHHYCQYCTIHFYDEGDFQEHCHGRHHYCSICRRVFRNDDGLRQHYWKSSKHQQCLPCELGFSDLSELKKHYESSDEHYYCEVCDRHFQSAQNLATHKLMHRPYNVQCPHPKCREAFQGITEVILHFENAQCPWNISLAQLERVAIECDTENFITPPLRNLSNCWNGYRYVCWLCDSTFRSESALDQHLWSQRHFGPGTGHNFECKTCDKSFSKLSSILQHIRSNSCGAASNYPSKMIKGIFARASGSESKQGLQDEHPSVLITGFARISIH